MIIINRSAAVFFCILFLAGCAAGPDYRQIDRQIRSGDCSGALDHLENRKHSYGSNQKLLYYMDAGMLNLRCGNYKEAARNFHLAENLADDLWTLSLSREAASFLLNDYTRPYGGEDFERAMINLMAAISYIEMGNHEAALVEFRRLDTLLAKFSDQYGGKNVYKEDALARYMSGILYEAEGSMDDAFIAYYKAWEIYGNYKKHYDISPPPTLAQDLCRVGRMIGRTGDVKKAKIDCNNPGDYIDFQEYGKVVFVRFTGSAPEKVSSGMILPTGYGPVKIAFPQYVVRPPAQTKNMLILESEKDRLITDVHLVQDVNRIAVKNLEDRRARITARMAARTVAKQAVIHRAAKEADSDSLKVWLNLVNLFVERADTRSWQTLPGEIHMAKIFVLPGAYTAYTASGRVSGGVAESDAAHGGGTRLETIRVKRGETAFVFQMM